MKKLIGIFVLMLLCLASVGASTVSDLTFGNLPDQHLPYYGGSPEENTYQGLNVNLFDLDAYANSDLGPIEFTLQEQTNPSLVYCQIDSSNQIDCTVAIHKSGTSEITIVADDGVEWIEDTFIITVPFPAAGDLDAQCMGHTIPQTMHPGEVADVTVTMKNTGDWGWTAYERDRLGVGFPKDDYTFGFPRTDLGSVDHILEGDVHTFSFSITAPQTQGDYFQYYQMVREHVAWHGDLCGTTISVVAPPTECSDGVDNDGDGLVDFPADPGCSSPEDDDEWNVQHLFSFDTLEDQNLPYYGGSPEENTYQGINEDLFNLEDFAGSTRQKVEFTLVDQSRSDIVDCRIDADNQMDCVVAVKKDGASVVTVEASDGVESEQQSFVVTVPFPTESDLDAACVAHTLPSAMQVGETLDVSVTMRNAGDWGWTAYERDRLGVGFPKDDYTFGFPRTDLGSVDHILEGDVHTFSFSITAPDEPGSYDQFYQMVREHVTWFGETCGNTITVEAIPECDDGVDNDGDGLVDFPADPGCSSPEDSDESNPVLAIEKIGPEEFTRGDGATYDITVTNTGDAPATGVYVVDWLQTDGFEFIPEESTVGCTLNEFNQVQCAFDDLIPGESATVKVAWKSPDDLTCWSSVTNQADLYADNADPEWGFFTSEVACNQCNDDVDNDGDGLVDFPDDPGCSGPEDDNEGNAVLKASKVGPEWFIRGDTVTYTIETSNVGDTTATDVTIVDWLHTEGFIFVPEESTTGCTLNEFNQVICDFGDLAPSETASVQVSWKSPDDLTCWSSVTNQADVYGDGAEADWAFYTSEVACTQCNDDVDNDHDALTDAEDPGCFADGKDPTTYDPFDDNEHHPVLEITKTGPTEFNHGDFVFYFIDVTNTGDATAEDVKMVDWFDTEGFTFVPEESTEGCILSETNRVVCDAGDVLPGEIVNYVITWQVGSEHTCDSTVMNQADVYSSNSNSDWAKVAGTVQCFQCSDNKDNDGDGLVDFPDDPGCDDKWDDDEWNVQHTFTFDALDDHSLPYYGGSPEEGTYQGVNENLFDLDNFAESTRGEVSFLMISQSRPDIVDCRIDDDNGMDCVVAVKKDGSSVVTVEARDGVERKQQSFTIRVPFPIDSDLDAACIDHTIPSVMEVGEVAEVSVTMSNTGDWSWTAYERDRLGVGYPKDDNTFGAVRTDLSGNDFVHNGDVHTFSFSITAPDTPGSYDQFYQMVREHVTWFGETCGTTIHVKAPLTECGDGVDNDGDGLVDFPDDPGCSSPEDDDEWDNKVPTALIAVEPSEGIEPLEVTISCDGYGGDGALEYLIDFDDGSQTEFRSEPFSVTHVYYEGYYEPYCVVKDIDEEIATDRSPVTVEFPVTECNDGVDNDGDGLVDYPDDPGCDDEWDDDEWNNLVPTALIAVEPSEGTEPLEVTISCDGYGGNGALEYLIDFDDGTNTGFKDAAFSATHVYYEGYYKPYCVVRDNDGETVSDRAPVTVNAYVTECNDGIDNDGDGAVDFPEDFSCSSPEDDDEEWPKAQCQDGIDNDGDGLVDFPDDPGCENKQDDDEWNNKLPEADLIVESTQATEPSTTVLTCVGSGGDGDLEFLIDFDDGSNTGFQEHPFTIEHIYYAGFYEPYCVVRDSNGDIVTDREPITVNEYVPDCRDGIDNDGDGAVDFPEDFGCESPEDDDETNDGTTECSDGITNDGDSYVDQDDPGCEDRDDDNENQAPILTPIGDKITPEGQELTFLVSAVDPEGDLLVFNAANVPPGAHFNAVTQVFEWTPSFTQAGLYQDTVFAVSDGEFQDNEAIDITVTEAGNHPPVIVTQPITLATEAVLYVYDVDATDLDDDILSYHLEVGPAGMTINTGSGAIAWTPTYAQIGENTVRVRVEDGNGGIDTQEFVVTVSLNKGINHAPIITSRPVTSLGGRFADDSDYMYDVNAIDPDNDVLTYRILSGPAGMTINSRTGKISWTPTQSQKGSVAVTVQADDGSLTDEQSFVITVSIPQRYENPRRALQIKTIEFINRDPWELRPGDDVKIAVTYLNYDRFDLEDVRMTASIFELDTWRASGKFDLPTRRETTKLITLHIPEDAQSGVYDLNIFTKENKIWRSVYREVRVV